jgi:hypothetical protein
LDTRFKSPIADPARAIRRRLPLQTLTAPARRGAILFREYAPVSRIRRKGIFQRYSEQAFESPHRPESGKIATNVLQFLHS